MYFIKVLLLNLVIGLNYCSVTSGPQSTSKVDYNNEERVKIQVYYETLCPGCRYFLSQELIPTLNELGPYMDVQMIPYGNAEEIEENGEYRTECQHGEPECYGNMLHGCAIHLLRNNELAIRLNECMMNLKPGSNNKALKYCAKKFNVDAEEIRACANSDLGIDILRKYGKITISKGVPYVPFITINGIDKESESDFKTEICKSLKNPPKECRS